MSKTDAQLIDPKEFGRRTFDVKAPVFDADCVARAEEALKALSGSFQGWLEEEVRKLQAARLAGEQAGWTTEALEALLGVAHDIKGLGATYDYPLATQIAASLCRLIETDAGKAAARNEPSLVHAHVDAVRAAARDQIKSAANPLGRALLRALEARVAELGVAPR
jgi:hypothetical protein